MLPYAGTGHRPLYMDAVFAQPEFKQLCDQEDASQLQQLTSRLFPEYATDRDGSNRRQS